VEFSSNDTSPLVAGCGLEETDTNTLAYQPAQTPVPRDASRLHSVTVSEVVKPGPYQVGYALNPGQKVVLSTYLRWNDKVRCFVTKSPAFNDDPSPWLELRVLAPGGAVIAGGDTFKDTFLFSTGHRTTAGSALGQRFLIEISYDEAVLASFPVPFKTGMWGLHCDSAAGMSEPIPYDMPGPDNF
jgi:hypothetical protein